jgi:transcriptional regulator with XRE-family HTH domain
MGSAHGLSKLTEDLVREIKRLKRDENMTGRERAKRFGVSTSVISEIDNNKAWTHVKLD